MLRCGWHGMKRLTQEIRSKSDRSNGLFECIRVQLTVTHHHWILILYAGQPRALSPEAHPLLLPPLLGENKRMVVRSERTGALAV
jgi:hypothetical protein